MDLLVTDPLVPLKVYFLSPHLYHLANTPISAQWLLKETTNKSCFLMSSCPFLFCLLVYKKQQPIYWSHRLPGHSVDCISKFFKVFSLAISILKAIKRNTGFPSHMHPLMLILSIPLDLWLSFPLTKMGTNDSALYFWSPPYSRKLSSSVTVYLHWIPLPWNPCRTNTNLNCLILQFNELQWPEVN